MMDDFFRKTRCDRCRGQLVDGRTMSRFNEDTICMECAEAECRHPDYRRAAAAERAAFRRGDRNFRGIGRPTKP